MRRIRPFTRHETKWFYALAPDKAGDAIFSQLFPLFLHIGLDLHVGAVGLLTAVVSLLLRSLYFCISSYTCLPRIFLLWRSGACWWRHSAMNGPAGGRIGRGPGASRYGAWVCAVWRFSACGGCG